MKKLFRNAVVTDKNSSRSQDVLTEGGRIIQTGKDILPDKDTEIFDLDGLTLMPGFIDMHAHLRTPGFPLKETFETGLRAALKGGFTTVCGMANTLPVMDTRELIFSNYSQANALNLTKYIQIGALGMNLSDEKITDLVSVLGVTSLLSNDGNTVFNGEFMAEALAESEKRGFLICTHCQPEAEIIARDLKLLSEHGGRLHICHVSEKESVRLIKKAKDSGLSFSCEVTPHHLFGYGIDYIVNPPIGSKEDNDALISAVKDGYITVLATDHAPHTEEDKKAASPGISNIETAFSMYYKVFHDKGISLNRLSEMISYAPAQLLGLKNGLIEKGYHADMTVVDEKYSGTINTDDFVSKSKNTPFGGQEIKGKVLMSIVGGEIRYDNRQTV